MEFRVGLQTDIGRKRSQNQDNCAAIPEIGLFMVSDGMGGHLGGETASGTAVEVISDLVRKASQKSDYDLGEVLISAFVAANDAIYQRSTRDAQLQGMGTTTTALLFKDHQLCIGHVGDSRCYYLRPKGLWQATRDHSLVQEKLRAGLIARGDVKTDRMKNVITRSVGYEPNVNVELYRMTVQKGDSFLICSDGLTGMVEDSTILQIIQKCLFENQNAQQAVTELVDRANIAGGEDNITSIMVQVI
jgi:protein phosphatase